MKIFNFKNNPYDLVFRYIFEEYKKKNKLNDDSTIIYPGIGKDIISISNIAKEYNYKLIVIAKNDIDNEIIDLLNKNNHELITIPYMLDIEELILMANDVSLDVDNSILLNLFKEKLAASAYFKKSKEIYDEFKGYDVLYLDIIFGIFSGVAKYFKMQDFDIRVIGIKKLNYESEIIDLDFFDDVITNDSKIEDNSLIIKI